MKLQMKRVRDILTGLTLLGQEPIETHLLNFRLTTAVSLVRPFVETLQKEEETILVEQCGKGPDDRALREESGAPKWLSPEGEVKAVAALKEILDAEVEVPGLVSLPWSLLEKGRCFYVSKETGARSREPLAVSVTVQLLLGDFLEGTPSETV
jgi:hypothetical protein